METNREKQLLQAVKDGIQLVKKKKGSEVAQELDDKLRGNENKIPVLEKINAEIVEILRR